MVPRREYCFPLLIPLFTRTELQSIKRTNWNWISNQELLHCLCRTLLRLSSTSVQSMCPQGIIIFCSAYISTLLLPGRATDNSMRCTAREKMRWDEIKISNYYWADGQCNSRGKCSTFWRNGGAWGPPETIIHHPIDRHASDSLSQLSKYLV